MAKFFDILEIVSKANRLYDSSKVFIAFIEKREIFPHVIKLKKLKQSDIQREYKTVLKEIDELKKLKVSLQYKKFNFKNIGTQNLPIETIFSDRDEFLKFINKEDEFNEFVKNYDKITQKYEVLKKLLTIKPKIIIQNLDNWDKLLSICDFFATNPNPNIYIRELAIKGVDTKFVEKNKNILDLLFLNILKENEFNDSIFGLNNYGFERKYGLKYPLPQVRFRVLDNVLKVAGLSDITLPVNEFEKLNLTCKNIFIIENQITTLSFPKIKNSIVIFGNGYKVGILKNVEWMRNKNIYYWGDIDKDGFAILSQVRGYFSYIKSIFMNKEVIELFKNFSVEDEKNQNNFKELKNLNDDEQKVYNRIQNNFYGTDFRLEQERIPFDYVCDKLKIEL